MFPRWLERTVAELLTEEPVLLLHGPRASGKTTLLRSLLAGGRGELVDLADDAVRNVAAEDPPGYLSGREQPICIDEYQRLPAVLGAVKRTVDQSQGAPGAFVLTGSATGALLPRGTETLAGRSYELTLWPLSQGEIDGVQERFLDVSFDDPPAIRALPPNTLSRGDLVDRVVRGGFPEAVRRERPEARRRWHTAYAARILDRDLADLVSVRQPPVFRRVLAVAAAQTAQLLNVARISSDLGAGRGAVDTYLELLTRLFLLLRVPAWSASPRSRVVQRPKLHVADSGLAASLLGLDAAALARSALAGPLVETFVVTELAKQCGWSSNIPGLSHYRDRDGREVDIMLERPDGRVVGVEVKSATAVNAADARGLLHVADALGDRFVHGYVLYTGDASIRLADDRITATPIANLWAPFR